MATIPTPLAFFGDIAAVEILLVAAVAVILFGKDLPQVAAKAFIQVQKLRRSVSQVWRESGMSEEIRKLQRELDKARRDLHRQLPRSEELVADARKSSEEVERAFHLGSPEDGEAATGADGELGSSSDEAADDPVDVSTTEEESGLPDEPTGEAGRQDHSQAAQGGPEERTEAPTDF